LSVKIVLVTDAFCAFIDTLARKAVGHHRSAVITVVSFDVELVIAFGADSLSALLTVLSVYATASAGFVLLQVEVGHAFSAGIGVAGSTVIKSACACNTSTSG
jgi:hypothetical protein